MRYALPAILVAGLATYGCVAPRERDGPAPPPQASVPAPSPAVRPAPTAPPVQAAAPPVGWADLPDTPGAWSFDDAAPAADFAGQFSLRCDRAARTVALARAGVAGPLTVTTTSAARTVAGPLTANDAMFDAIAFSRGHFTVDAPGQPRLVIPAQPEVARVVEECRG